MDLSSLSVSFECSIIVSEGKTQFTLNEKSYEVPFSIPITQKDGCLFGKESTYSITKKREKCKTTYTEVCFKLYYIELYENEFTKALVDFKKLVSLDVSSDVLKEVIIKALFNLLDISIKSYDKACAYIARLDLTYDSLEGTFIPRFEGSFRQYCGLE